MAYLKTSKVIGGTTTALADQYNSLMAEMKAAAEGLSTHDVDVTIAYVGSTWKIDTITYVDNEADANFDLDAVSTYSYTGLKVTQVATVFSAMGITMTEVFSYSGWKLTGIARTLS